MSLIRLEESRKAIKTFFSKYKCNVSKHTIDLFLLDHGHGHSFKAIKDLLKLYGYKSLLIHTSFDNLEQMPLPGFIQSKDGFFYAIDQSADSKTNYYVNDVEYTVEDIYLKFLPCILIAEIHGDISSFDYVKHPLNQLLTKIGLVFIFLLFIYSSFVNVTAVLSLLGIMVSIVYISKSLLESYGTKVSNYICVETKFTGCFKNNSYLNKIMSFLGLFFFLFVFLSAITYTPIQNSLSLSIPLLISVTTFSVYWQWYNKQICLFCVVTIIIIIGILFTSKVLNL